MRKGRHSTEAAKKTWKTALTGFTGYGWPAVPPASQIHLDVSVSEHSQAPAGPQPWRLGSISALTQEAALCSRRGHGLETEAGLA